MFIKNIIFLSLLVFSFIACGGGSSSDSDLVVEGQLIEGSGDAHTRSNFFKHEAGEGISEVEICALGTCSTTDDQGNYGFLVSEDFAGGQVLFTVKGHGIDTTVTVPIGADTKDAFVHLQHSAGVVTVHHLEIDGVGVDATAIHTDSTAEDSEGEAEEHDHSTHEH